MNLLGLDYDPGISNECRAGQHDDECSGEGWPVSTDRPAPCSCPCHRTTTAASADPKEGA